MRGFVLYIVSCFFLMICLVLWIHRATPKPQPVGRYVQFGMGPLILDTTNGHVCDSYPSGSQYPGGYPPCSR